MKILITGANGMLGNYIAKKLNKNKIYASSNSSNLFNYANFLNFDLSIDDYKDLFSWIKPDLVIHCAAITDVNFCESNPKKSYLINFLSIRKLFKIYKDTFFIFISSDAVFNGSKKFPKEDDLRKPLNNYGIQKKEAEDFIISNFKKFTIIRTTPIGININRNNLLTWFIKRMNNHEKINLYSNIFFTPIDLYNLTEALNFIIENQIYGIYHIVSNDRISKYDFCFQLSAYLNFNKNLLVNSNYTHDKILALRSLDQSMDNSKFNNLFNNKLPNLQDVIKNIITDL